MASDALLLLKWRSDITDERWVARNVIGDDAWELQGDPTGRQRSWSTRRLKQVCRRVFSRRRS